jgi:hypothetical protein
MIQNFQIGLQPVCYILKCNGKSVIHNYLKKKTYLVWSSLMLFPAIGKVQ